MSTFTAVGPRLDLDGPLPLQPPHSLLNTAGVVVPVDDEHVFTGVNVLAHAEDTPSLMDPCAEGTFRSKDEGGGTTIATFDAFTCYIPVTCSSLNWESIVGDAQLVLEAVYSMGVESALASGIFGSNNPYFGDTNLSVLGGATVTPSAGLSYLEDAIGATGRKGMIHATPSVISALVADKLEEDDEGGLYTLNGTPVVSGDGYIGVDPDNGSSPAAGQSWMFATGPVEVRLGALEVQPIRTSLDRSDNSVTFRAERAVLALWDTVLQAGVLVDWDP